MRVRESGSERVFARAYEYVIEREREENVIVSFHEREREKEV